MASRTVQSSPGVSDVASYQVSAVPWVTGSVAVANTSATKLAFPSVTKYFDVKATTNDIRVGFTQVGVSGSSKYYTVTAGTEHRFDVRCKEAWFIADGGGATLDVHAGLTVISPNKLLNFNSLDVNGFVSGTNNLPGI